MSAPKSYQVAGVDGCKAGWCVAVARAVSQTGRLHADCVLRLERILVASAFAEVLAETQDCELVCVDIPIGLSDNESPRDCDISARKILRGPRASSVFPAPIRPCLSAVDYDTASRISLEYSGKKLNRQSFALLKKIRQVDQLMTPTLQDRVREIHPEVSFWALNGKKAVEQNKKTVAGQAKRHKLLQRVFTNMDEVLNEGLRRGYGMDDAFDALAAAWTAGQTVSGKAGTLPKNPRLDSRGLRMEIFCPAV
ncbi:MAG TPA: DUF429 domain-containing protein [Sedimentisphaerales bacterium]|nr:DUF429 domain-containing protein [Sedimentisphaerales bacterium]